MNFISTKNMSNGKIYLGNVFVNEPDAGGSTVEYVTLTFSGCNKGITSGWTVQNAS